MGGLPNEVEMAVMIVVQVPRWQIARLHQRVLVDQLGNGSIVSISAGGKLVAIAETDAGVLRPVRVMNL